MHSECPAWDGRSSEFEDLGVQDDERRDMLVSHELEVRRVCTTIARQEATTRPLNCRSEVRVPGFASNLTVRIPRMTRGILARVQR